MNKFETSELMSNWKNELEICWNKLKYVEINWNVIFSKIILIVILKGKRAVPVQLYIFIIFMCLHMNKFETNELMSNWKNELEDVEINWNMLK